MRGELRILSRVFIVSSTSAQAGPSTLLRRCAMLNSVRMDCTFLGASTRPASGVSPAAAAAAGPPRGLISLSAAGASAPTPRGLRSASPAAGSRGQASAKSQRLARNESRGSSIGRWPQAWVNTW